MGIFSWFSDFFTDPSTSGISSDNPFSNNDSNFFDDYAVTSMDSSIDDHAINPANGLPMVNGMGGIDIAGNPYGTDFSHDDPLSGGIDHSCHSGIDDSRGCGIDDSFGCGIDDPCSTGNTMDD